jgi:hypothetical protein
MPLWNLVSNGSFVQPRHDTGVNVEQRCNDTDRGKLEDSEISLSQRHSVHHRNTCANKGCRNEGPVTNRRS